MPLPDGEAKERAPLIKELFPRYRVVVLLGRCVVEAMGYDKILDSISWTSIEGSAISFYDTMVYSLPHPSGVNHWYNNHANCCAARDVATQILRRAFVHLR